MVAQAPRFSRRKALLCAAAVACAAAPTRSRAATARFRIVDLHFEASLPKARIARVLLPRGFDRNQEASVVVLLHGYGAAASESRSLQAWQAEYGVELAYERLLKPPLSPVRRGQCLTQARCDELNQSLEQQAFRGMILVCPLTLVPYHGAGAIKQYAEFLGGELLSALKSTLSIKVGSVGLAGVSMGGRVGLEVMAERPESFSGFVGLQSHVEPHEAAVYASRLAAAFERTGPRSLLIHTSTEDCYAAANRGLSKALSDRRIEHELRVSPGPHTAAWMRESGALEALYWHDRLSARGSKA